MRCEFKEWLYSEVHWEDLYPKSFAEFRKKYNKIVRQGQGNDLYIQFSNFSNDTLHKNAYSTPNHTDPVGTYAYPLKYVLSHPADIWYGQKANHMRLLEATPSNVLVLNNLDMSTAKNLLYRMGIDGNYLDIALKHYKYKSSNKIGQAFMSAVQMRFDQPPQELGKDYFGGKETYPMRTGAQQTALFKKAGVDAIEDKSNRNSQAAINSREPEQIVFLTRNSFKVLEVIQLRQGDPDRAMTTLDLNEKIQGRKLISAILDKIDGDKIISGPLNTGGLTLYWTHKGRRIGISFARNQDYYKDKKLREKKHKEDKLNNSFETEVWIQNSEKENIHRKFNNNEKFKDIIDSVVWNWNKAIDNPNFEPDTQERYTTAVKDQQNKEQIERHAKEAEKEKLEQDELLPKLIELAKRLDVPFNSRLNTKYVELFGTIQNIASNSLSYNPHENKERLVKFWSDQADNYEKVLSDDPEFLEDYIIAVGYFPKDLSNRPDLEQIKQIFNKMHTTIGHINHRTGIHVITHALNNLNRDQD